jgi:glycosyltransferase involved in cell wall biosynthesis
MQASLALVVLAGLLCSCGVGLDLSSSAKGNGVVCYKGVLTSDQVYKELFNYDALILPTFYEGEGYPGVIIEAYSHGIPVIATRWRSIPEIVTDETGILIPTHSAEALGQAINLLHTDNALYMSLKRGALSKRTEFSDSYWTDRFVEWCEKLIYDGVRN